MPKQTAFQYTEMNEQTWRFAGFTYSPQQGLSYGGDELKLGPQARQLLELLLEAKGGVVTRQEIGARLWKGRPASEESIDRCVYLLRKPLREAGFGDLVSTAYGRGLSLRATVEATSQPMPARSRPAAGAVVSEASAADSSSSVAPTVMPAEQTKMVELAIGDIVVRFHPDVKEEQLARILRVARAAKLTSAQNG